MILSDIPLGYYFILKNKNYNYSLGYKSYASDYYLISDRIQMSCYNFYSVELICGLILKSNTLYYSKQKITP